MIRLNRIIARDTFAYQELDFRFDSGIHSIKGANGASKTSIFMALCQGLFNRNPKGTKVDAVSNSVTGKPYEIEVFFTKNGKEYHIRNSKKTGKIEIYEDGKDKSLKRIPDNLKLIEDILGCDYATFADLVYQSPDSAINLLETKSDGERKKFINRILRLDELDHHLTRMKQQEKELTGKNGQIASLQKQIETLEASLNEPQEELEEIDAAELEAKLAEARQEYNTLVEEAIQLRTAYADAADKLADAKLQEHDRVWLEDCRTKLANLEAVPLAPEEELQQRRDSLIQEGAEGTSTHNGLQEQARKYQQTQAIRTQLGETEKALARLELPEHDEAFCRSNLQKLQALKASSETTVVADQTEVRKLKGSLGNGVCPTCKQELPNRDEIEKEIAVLEQRIAVHSVGLNKALGAIPKWEGYVSAWQKRQTLENKAHSLRAQVGEPLDIEDIQKKMADCDTSQARLQGALVKISEGLKLHQECRSLRDEISSLVGKLGGEPGDLNQLAQTVETLKGKVAEGETARAAAQGRVQSLESGLETARNHNALARARKELNRQIEESNRGLRATIDQLRKELAEAEDTLEHVQLWVQLLGNSGFRVHKIARFLKSLNSTMRKYGEMISDGRIQCVFWVDEDGEIQFTVTDPHKTQPWENWSAGEKMRVKMACLFAVLELLEIIGAVSFNVLCLDEVFGALDSEGKEGLFRVLDYLRGRDKATYLIAHTELALPLVYDSTILAEKHYDGTTSIKQ